MYLAKHVGGWSLPKIGKFYNGRHHTTVPHALAKIDRLRKQDEAFDALIDVLTTAVRSEGKRCGAGVRAYSAHCELVDGDCAPDDPEYENHRRNAYSALQCPELTEAYPLKLTDTSPANLSLENFATSESDTVTG